MLKQENDLVDLAPERHGYSEQAYVTTLSLGLAAWLIFNSHLEAFYPIPWMAADGLLGNTLFFVMSGLGIFSSLNKRHQSIRSYISRRFWRLYPAVFIVLLMQTIFILPISKYGPIDVLKTFIWPSPFTYVAVIVPTYLLAFACHRLRPKNAAYFMMGLCLLVYCIGYIQSIDMFSNNQKLIIGHLPSLVSYGYFAFAFALGGLVSSRKNFTTFSWSWLSVAVFLTGLYVGIKYLMVVKGEAGIAYPTLHFLVLALCMLALKILCAPDLVSRVLDWPIVGPFLRKSGSLSLEIYLVHAVLLHVLLFSIPIFPLNIFSFAAITFILAIGLAGLTRIIRHRFGA